MENKSCCQLSSRYPWSLLTLHDSLYKTKRIQKRERENYTVFFENIHWSLSISQAQGGALFSCDSIKPSPPHLISIFVLSTPTLDWKSQEAKICSYWWPCPQAIQTGSREKGSGSPSIQCFYPTGKAVLAIWFLTYFLAISLMLFQDPDLWIGCLTIKSFKY